jgi:hypothetical protein
MAGFFPTRVSSWVTAHSIQNEYALNVTSAFAGSTTMLGALSFAHFAKGGIRTPLVRKVLKGYDFSRAKRQQKHPGFIP